MKIERLLTNVCSNNLEESKSFYLSLFNFEVSYDSDWFVHLVANGHELGIILPTNEIVPQQAKGNSAGVYLTFVVADVDELFTKIKPLNYDIIQNPTDTPYGQKRMVLLAPEGTVCDISSPIRS